MLWAEGTMRAEAQKQESTVSNLTAAVETRAWRKPTVLDKSLHASGPGMSQGYAMKDNKTDTCKIKGSIYKILSTISC